MALHLFQDPERARLALVDVFTLPTEAGKPTFTGNPAYVVISNKNSSSFEDATRRQALARELQMGMTVFVRAMAEDKQPNPFRNRNVMARFFDIHFHKKDFEEVSGWK